MVNNNDKIWFDYRSKNEVMNDMLKKVSYIREKQDDMITHTDVASAMIIPVNIQFKTI